MVVVVRLLLTEIRVQLFQQVVKQVQTFVYRQNEAANFISAGVSLWRSTSAINRITLNATSTNSLQAGTQVSLYGIKAA